MRNCLSRRDGCTGLRESLFLAYLTILLFGVLPSSLPGATCADNVYEAKLPSGKTQLCMLIASPQRLVDPMGFHIKTDFEVDSVIDIPLGLQKEVPTLDECLKKVNAFVIVTQRFRMKEGAQLITGGKDLIIYADEVMANPSAHIDLSVPTLVFPKTAPPKAAAGTAAHPNGFNGDSGAPGIDAGNLTWIVQKDIFSLPFIKSVGGTGGVGGDGGNGLDSVPGGSPHPLFKRVFDTQLAVLPLIAKGNDELVVEKKDSNAPEISGGNATPAGNGGNGGRGRSGGKGGDVFFKIGKSSPLTGDTILAMAKGKNDLTGGASGRPGSGGNFGHGAPGGTGTEKLVHAKTENLESKYTISLERGASGTIVTPYKRYTYIRYRGKKGTDAPPGKPGISPANETSTAPPGNVNVER